MTTRRSIKNEKAGKPRKGLPAAVNFQKNRYLLRRTHDAAKNTAAASSAVFAPKAEQPPDESSEAKAFMQRSPCSPMLSHSAPSAE